jgi:lipopolysaccharide export system protein LptA
MGKQQKIIFYGGMGILGSMCLLPLFAQTKPGMAQTKPNFMQSKSSVAQVKPAMTPSKQPLPIKLSTSQIKPIKNKIGRIATKQNNPPSTPPTSGLKNGGLPPRFQGTSDGKVGADMPTKPVNKDDIYVYLWADHAQIEDINKESIVTLIGKVQIFYQETIVETEKIVYNRETQIGNAPVKVKMQDKDNILTGSKGFANYKTSEMEIVGNVELKTQPKSEKLKKDLEGPIRLTCKKILYNWDTKRATPSGDIHIYLRAQKKDWVFTSDTAEYDGAQEMFVLKGNVHGVAEDGQTTDGSEVYIDMKQDAAKPIVSVKFKGRFKDEVKKEKSKSTSTVNFSPPPPPVVAEETTPPVKEIAPPAKETTPPPPK